MAANLLTLNVLNFDFATPALSCYLNVNPVEGALKLSDRSLDFFIRMLNLPSDTAAIYTTFDTESTGSRLLTLSTFKSSADSGEMMWPLSFLKNYYTSKLTRYFSESGFPVRTNFISDTEVWIPGSSPYKDCTGYKGFRLRVQFGKLTNKPELLVSYDGIHSVYNYPLTDSAVQELDPKVFGWVLFRNRLFRYDEMSDEARRNADEVFPCRNKHLHKALKTPFPAPDKSNRYKKYLAEIDGFRNRFLVKGTDDFMHIHPEWVTREPQSLLTDDTDRQKLLFGNGGTDNEPKNGMKLYGPKELSPDRKTVFFFICHRNDTNMAKTINKYMSGTIPGFVGVNKYAGILYSTVKDLSIYFDDKENPLPEIVQQLNARNFETDTRYVALYLSPFSKWDSLDTHKAVYYLVKEELLHRNIVSQAIEVEKNWTDRKVNDENMAVLKNGFHFSLPNISVALLAKLGGSPWTLANGTQHELVIGISAFKSDDLKNKYLGSAFSFSGEGRFCGFDCFRSNQMDELAGSILLAVKDYCRAHTVLDKLVIHFYKTLSRKELMPIEQGLAKLGLEIPVVVISINKMYSKDIIGFDTSQANLMPYSHTYLQVSENQYLVYNNGLHQQNSFVEREGYPFPLKVSTQYFAVGEATSEPVDKSLIPALFDQICQFSQLYWKSISRQSLPVTLRFPEMIAQIVPHFSRPELPRTGRETLWFL